MEWDIPSQLWLKFHAVQDREENGVEELTFPEQHLADTDNHEFSKEGERKDTFIYSFLLYLNVSF